MELFRSKNSQEFAKQYGLAFAHINFIDHWLGQLVLLVKYPEFLSNDKNVAMEDLQKDFERKAADIENTTFGQKIAQLRALNYADIELVQKLEELNRERKILAHFPSAEDEEGETFFFSLLPAQELPIQHNFNKIIQLSDELHVTIAHKFGEMGAG